MPEVYRGRKSRGRKSGRKSPRKYSKGRKSGRKSPRHSRGRNRFRGVTYRGDAGVSLDELSDLQTPVPHLEDEFAEGLGPNADVLQAEAVLEERRNTLLRNIQDDQGELVELENFMEDPFKYKPLTEEQKAKRQREIVKLGYIGLGKPKQSKRNRSRMSGQASSSNKPAPQ